MRRLRNLLLFFIALIIVGVVFATGNSWGLWNLVGAGEPGVSSARPYDGYDWRGVEVFTPNGDYRVLYKLDGGLRDIDGTVPRAKVELVDHTTVQLICEYVKDSRQEAAQRFRDGFFAATLNPEIFHAWVSFMEGRSTRGADGGWTLNSGDTAVAVHLAAQLVNTCRGPADAKRPGEAAG